MGAYPITNPYLLPVVPALWCLLNRQACEEALQQAGSTICAVNSGILAGPGILFAESKKDDENRPNEDTLSDKEEDIATKTGLTNKEVKKKIHKAKKNLPKSGPIRNPNVIVDTKTGEIYPKIPGGGYGDPIGNIFD